MRRLLRPKPIAGVLLLGILAANLVAFSHARAFTRFAPPGRRTRPPEVLSFAEKIQVLASGVDARGTVVLFHGHAASKDSQLSEARAFYGMGFNTLLVDFHGSGGSGASETSIGFHEATDVALAYRYSRSLPGAGPIVLYGASMGAAAVLKGVGDENLRPAGLILECPFDSLIGTTRHRFSTMGVPPFPMADLLVFWGGVQQGFDGFGHRPVDSAAHIDRPTLLMSGESDPWVTSEETRAIYAALRGPKTLQFFEGLGHDGGLRRRPVEWKAAVSRFLDGLTGPT